LHFSRGLFELLNREPGSSVQSGKRSGTHFWKALMLSTGAGRGTGGRDLNRPAEWPNRTAWLYVVLVLLCYSLTKLLLPAETAASPAVIPRPVPGTGHQQGFQ